MNISSGRKDCSDGSDEVGCPFDFSEYEEYLKDIPDKDKPPFPSKRDDDEEEEEEEESDDTTAKKPKQKPRQKPPPKRRARSEYKSYPPGEVPDDFVCPHNLFTCNNKECVNSSSRCDGSKHCSDGSDEWNCGSAGGEL